MGEAVVAVMVLCGTIASTWLVVAGVRRVSENLPDDAERIRWHTFKVAYPIMLTGTAAGIGLAVTAADHLAIGVETMPGVGLLVTGLIVGLAPGMTIASRGSRAYQRALDAHYEGTRWARPPKS